MDTLKKYASEKNAGDNVHEAHRAFENALMGMRMQNSNTQPSMNSDFAKKNLLHFAEILEFHRCCTPVL
jgi:hypothetical protein